MKNLFSSALHCDRNSFAPGQLANGFRKVLFFSSLILFGFFLIGCEKEGLNSPKDEAQINPDEAANIRGNILSQYTGLSWQTLWELQQARAATAKYQNFENAIKVGYADIEVVVEEMGYHFLKSDHLNATVDFRKPEILVYNKDEDGNMHLVAVEYAVPLDLSANAPAGFTGDNDVWDRNTTFGLWLLHAWVWHANPAGVFNPTNPDVHVH